MKIKRVFLIVMDSFGCGYAKDAAAFGDEGSNTLRSVSSVKGFAAPNLAKLGLFHIDHNDTSFADGEPVGVYARIHEKSMGKDTTIGHWEIGGIVSEKPLPTYPDGFPDEVLDEFKKQTGRDILCNKPYSGTQVIADYGEEHVKTGKLIVYTSADSVFQIAAHEDVVPVEELYRYCEIARKILVGRHGVGRVIARPFTGEHPYTRTTRRHDFSAKPPKKTILDLLQDKGLDTVCVGKISDIFAGVGVSESTRTTGNDDGMRVTMNLLDKDFTGLCFVNLVDFDMLYGHRRNVQGYADAVMAFDRFLADFTKKMNDDDVLMITADHGCDPLYKGTDHTRENIPFLMYNKHLETKNLHERNTYADIAATVADIFDTEKPSAGTSMLPELHFTK